jgi:hypothetical protein
MAYTLAQVREYGAPIAMGLLLKALEGGEPFVTYKDIKVELEKKLNVKKIFPTQIGHAAGSLMDQILLIDENAPLINILITRDNGVPGEGAGWYLAERYNRPNLKEWDNISYSMKLELVEKEREKIRKYSFWEDIEEKLFGDSKFRPKKKEIIERDGKSPDGRRGGLPESEDHKNLKNWVANNPQKIGLGKKFINGVVEVPLLSGDIVDVVFSNGNDFVVVEVKSHISNDLDLRRGLYQCVKYRSVKEAEEAPVKSRVRAILVTERKLPKDLYERSKILNIKSRTVAVNI